MEIIGFHCIKIQIFGTFPLQFYLTQNFITNISSLITYLGVNFIYKFMFRKILSKNCETKKYIFSLCCTDNLLCRDNNFII